MVTSDDRRPLRALLDWAGEVDTLHDRYFISPPGIDPGSRTDADDDALRPYHLSHEVSQRLSVAVDSLHGLRMMCVDTAQEHVNLRTFAPYPLLRAAVENACTVAWLLHPDDQLARVTRRFHLWARSHDARNDVEKIMSANPPKGVKPVSPTGWSRDGDFIGRMRDAGVADVDKILKDPKRNTTSTTAMVDQGADALGRRRNAYPATHYRLVWRSFSGASHGDLWALMSLPDREIVGEPDPITDRVGSRVFMTAEKLALWTHVTTTAVKGAISIYDRSRLVLREHAPNKPV
jgi:hypothetical protein